MVLGKAFQKMPYAGQNFENDRHSKAGFCGQIQCGPGHYPTPTLLSQCGMVSVFTTQTDQYMLVSLMHLLQTC